MVTNSMRSEKNTQTLNKLWNDELSGKNPSILRAIFKLYGAKVYIVIMIYTISDTLAK